MTVTWTLAAPSLSTSNWSGREPPVSWSIHVSDTSIVYITSHGGGAMHMVEYLSRHGGREDKASALQLKDCGFDSRLRSLCFSLQQGVSLDFAVSASKLELFSFLIMLWNMALAKYKCTLLLLLLFEDVLLVGVDTKWMNEWMNKWMIVKRQFWFLLKSSESKQSIESLLSLVCNKLQRNNRCASVLPLDQTHPAWSP